MSLLEERFVVEQQRQVIDRCYDQLSNQLSISNRLLQSFTEEDCLNKREKVANTGINS